jgi:hypothetical protein
MKGGNPDKSSVIWDANKKRPSNLTIFFMITMTVIFLVAGTLSTIASFHEIRVVVDSNSECYGNVEFNGNYNSISRGTGRREFTFQVRVGVKVTVNINRIRFQGQQSTLTLEIFDNGELGRERTSISSSNNMRMEYTVGTF